MLAPGPAQQEIPLEGEYLFGELASLVNPLLQRVSLSHASQCVVDGSESACSIDKTPAPYLGLIKGPPKTICVTFSWNRDGCSMPAEHEGQKILGLGHFLNKAACHMPSEGFTFQALGGLDRKAPRGALLRRRNTPFGSS